jgi:hypothetical protein
MVTIEALQTLLTFVTLISVLVGVFYHIMTLRNTRKNQEFQLETRQMNSYLTFLSKPELIMAFNDVVYIHKWKDYNEWLEKYSAFANPEEFNKLWLVLDFLNGMGVLVRKGLIDMEIIAEQWAGGVIEAWVRLQPIILEWRNLGEDYFVNSFEYLYEESKKILPNYVLWREHPHLQENSRS